MEGFDESVAALTTTLEEVMALLPEEPTTELEAKVSELANRLGQHFVELELALSGEEPADDDAVDDIADDDEE